jgi:hypothetical protein
MMVTKIKHHHHHLLLVHPLSTLIFGSKLLISRKKITNIMICWQSAIGVQPVCNMYMYYDINYEYEL